MVESRYYQIVLNQLRTNCYLLEKDNHCVLFDPSMDSKKDMDKLKSKIKDEWTVDAIILTHGHVDHISAVDWLYGQHHCPIYLHKNDEPYLSDPKLNGSALLGVDVIVHSEVTLIEEGPLKIGNFEFDVMLTPGHTPGSITLFYENLAFTGDALFKGTIGRTDLRGSSQREMDKTLEKFKAIEKDYIILPGHGQTTTLDKEKVLNPFLNRG